MIVTIELDNISFRAYHGCYDLENKVGNNFRVDLTVIADIGDAALNDDVTAGVNYLLLYDLVEEQMKIISNTIEHVGMRVVSEIISRFDQVLEAKVRVCKLAPPLGGKAEKVCATISKCREGWDVNNF